MDCLFCKIAEGEISSYTVFEDQNVLAFLDIHPCSKGHTIVIPKKHFDDISKMSEQDYVKMTNGLKHTLERIQTIIHPDGVNMGINNGLAAGQAVAHAHWHIIPRWNNDGGGSMHSIIKNGEGVDVKAVAELFK